jgi:hypothetical protein
VEPLVTYMRGPQSFGATSQEKAEAEAAKICKDYDLPEVVCKGLVECIKGGNLRQCFNEAVALAAGAGCAALPGGTFYAAFCAGVARWLVSKIGTVGYITTSGCQIAPRRYVNVPEPIVEKSSRRVGDKEVHHWGIRWRTPSDLNVLVGQLNPGEYAQVWSQAAPVEGGGTSRVSITPMFYVGCSQEQIDAGVTPTYGADEIQRRMDGGYASAALRRAAATKWSSPNILAVRDWDGTVYHVTNYKQPYWFAPALKIKVTPAPGAYQLYEAATKVVTAKFTATQHPAGTVAVFDSVINKYRLIAPA